MAWQNWLTKTITIKHDVFEYPPDDEGNLWVFVVARSNSRLTDTYVARRADLNPDGTIKKGKIKYYFDTKGDGEKEVKIPAKIEDFRFFDSLLYIDEMGVIRRQDGSNYEDE